MAPIRLCRSNIGNLPQGVAVPPEECYGLGVGIVHFGVGGFHRRHQALYTQRAIGLRNSGDWGIVGVGLLPTDVDLRDRLREQDFLYSVIERAGTKRSEIDITVVGTLQDFILPFESAEAALSVQKYLTAASTKVVTLTSELITKIGTVLFTILNKSAVLTFALRGLQSRKKATSWIAPPAISSGTIR